MPSTKGEALGERLLLHGLSDDGFSVGEALAVAQVDLVERVTELHRTYMAVRIVSLETLCGLREEGCTYQQRLGIDSGPAGRQRQCCCLATAAVK